MDRQANPRWTSTNCLTQEWRRVRLNRQSSILETRSVGRSVLEHCNNSDSNVMAAPDQTFLLMVRPWKTKEPVLMDISLCRLIDSFIWSVKTMFLLGDAIVVKATGVGVCRIKELSAI